MNVVEISEVLEKEATPRMIRIQDELWKMVVKDGRQQARRPSAQLCFIVAEHYKNNPVK